MQAKYDLEVEKDRLETGLREKSPSSPVRVRLQRGNAPGPAQSLPTLNYVFLREASIRRHRDDIMLRTCRVTSTCSPKFIW
ncbi:hypothetical protein DNFV4_03569 [Nitrospira tepida]|uniref:Uncharacterized protein n=1 Tax=Nitrospira tepida TaxID=2973512 RepID=A0AA86T7I5_9BACT|nr:hypothetical protein DNFV4_03569 [Nitrospira tepida]